MSNFYFRILRLCLNQVGGADKDVVQEEVDVVAEVPEEEEEVDV